jgi:hypothetical protein
VFRHDVVSSLSVSIEHSAVLAEIIEAWAYKRYSVISSTIYLPVLADFVI